jgi:hypothetical protein
MATEQTPPPATRSKSPEGRVTQRQVRLLIPNARSAAPTSPRTLLVMDGPGLLVSAGNLLSEKSKQAARHFPLDIGLEFRLLYAESTLRLDRQVKLPGADSSVSTASLGGWV